jgi:hypothetical protein
LDNIIECSTGHIIIADWNTDTKELRVYNDAGDVANEPLFKDFINKNTPYVYLSYEQFGLYWWTMSNVKMMGYSLYGLNIGGARVCEVLEYDDGVFRLRYNRFTIDTIKADKNLLIDFLQTVGYLPVNCAKKGEELVKMLTQTHTKSARTHS